MLGDDALARDALEATARRILERAGYERIETPAFEPTELFARGVGASTDIVRKEMYSFEDAGGRSLTLRPEGTAPVCRAYMEHGMHKRPQPVKLWYLSSFFRAEQPQKGRYRQFWQLGAEAIGSDDPAVDAELIVLLAELLEELGAQGIRLRIGSLGTPAAPRRLPRGAAGLPRATLDLRRGRCATARTRTRCGCSTPRRDADGATRRGCSTASTPRTASTSPRSERCSTASASATRSTRRSCAAWTTTRARSSSSPATRSARSPASAAAGATTG